MINTIKCITKHGLKYIQVTTPNIFVIKDPTLPVKGIIYFYTNYPITISRNDLISLAFSIRSKIEKKYWGLDKKYPANLDILVGVPELAPYIPNTVKIAIQQAIKKATEEVLLQAKKAEEEALYQVKLQEAIASGKWWDIEVWPKGQKIEVPNIRYLNIGGYGVTSHPISSENPMVRLVYITGSKFSDSSFSTPSYTELEAFPQAYIEPFTLINLQTLLPDLDKTEEWHQKDPEFIQKLKASQEDFYGRWTIFGGYYIKEEAPKTELNLKKYPENLPKFCCEDLTKRLAEIGCPEAEVKYAAWCFVHTNFEKPLFKDGAFYKYAPIEHRHFWALRIGAYLNGERWNCNSVHFWITYNPKIDPEHPWRFVKSTSCQRQSAWSKHQFYYQIEPEVTWCAEEWMVQSLSQLTNMYPKEYQPIFRGSFNKVTPSLKNILQEELAKGKALLNKYIKTEQPAEAVQLTEAQLIETAVPIPF